MSLEPSVKALASIVSYASLL